MIVSKKTWIKVFERDKGFCRYCGADLLSSLSAFCSATVDHLVPRSAGGGDGTENLVTACTGCNGMLSRAKHLTTFEERKASVEQRRAEGQTFYDGFVDRLRSPR